MLSRLLLPVLAVIFAAAPLGAQSTPPSLEVARSLDTRRAVEQQWRLPSLKADALVRVKAVVGTAGNLQADEISVETLNPEDREAARTSVEAALGQTRIALAPGPVEFSLRARSGPRVPGCFPLKIYVPTTVTPGAAGIPEAAVRGMQQGVLKWNAALVGYHKGSVLDPFVLTDRRELADIVIEAFEDYTDFSSYLVDEQTGRTTLRIPLKRPLAVLFGSSLRWWHPEQITQQTMFQLGRVLGLGLSEVPTNVLWPSQSLYFVQSSTDVAGTRAPQIESARSATLGSVGIGGRTGVSFDVTPGDPLDYGGGDRTLTNYQLEDAGDLVRTRTCGSGLRANRPELNPTG